ncbi:PREDICTED: T-complex-associated testis-expressed protein 1-like isoform X2 [Priapulus caudatus]|uniref:T-complex-associated testis-expressed protein 1-like isoform X2 n=1 Tax=Priapulus caudatus TaxID=37621 RepID=A0ABM1FB51_PRICU|nr:PREDICTED: T-complex-associated testis-expressed protein 1-like isoform X2 [Priapulus caudatus]
METDAVHESLEENPAVDPRKMRSIIAEDPEWSLEIVSMLSDLCIENIVKNFADHPIVDGLLSKHRKKVIERISTLIPVSITAPLIDDECYWQRCCTHRWKVCDVSLCGNSWKRMYFEYSLQELVQNFIPGRTELMCISELLQLGSGIIKCLNIKEMLPPMKEAAQDKDSDTSDGESESGQDEISIDHFDFTVLISQLPCLEEFRITYRVRNCGMNFEWRLFLFTLQDCHLLAKCLSDCKTLRVLKVTESKVNDVRCKMLAKAFREHPALEELDLSHNLIKDSGAKSLAKLINGQSKLKRLKLADNSIGEKGGQALAAALQNNDTLVHLDLRLNVIGDEGGKAIYTALLENSTLKELDLSANVMRGAVAPALKQLVVSNTSLQILKMRVVDFCRRGWRRTIPCCI